MGRDVTGLRAGALKPKPSPNHSSDSQEIDEATTVSAGETGSLEVVSDQNGNRGEDIIPVNSPNEDKKKDIKSSRFLMIKSRFEGQNKDVKTSNTEDEEEEKTNLKSSNSSKDLKSSNSSKDLKSSNSSKNLKTSRIDEEEEKEKTDLKCSNSSKDLKSPNSSKDVKSSKIEEEETDVKSSGADGQKTEETPSKIQEEDVEKKDVNSSEIEEQKKDAKASQTEQAEPSTAQKAESGPNAVRSEKAKRIVKKPLDLSDDHQECASPKPAETPVSRYSRSPNVCSAPSPCSSKKSQPSPFISRKRLEDEDNCSLASSTAASVRCGRSRTTVPVAPKFTVEERLEKRREYYAKLEEKHRALEAEKREYEARTKEEQEAALKQLRKSMVFKANPVPCFIYENPPPKKELKKAPTTRAVSPKFGRRKSFGDASSSRPEVVKVASNTKSVRRSLGSNSRKESSASVSSTPSNTSSKKKVPLSTRQPSGNKSRKERLKELEESASQEPANSAPHNMTEQQANADISVES